MSEQKAESFDWIGYSLCSFGIGCLLATAPLLLAFVKPRSWLMENVFDTLAWPGTVIAQWYFGGLHGGEPFMLLIAVNTFVYGAACLLILRLRYKRARQRGVRHSLVQHADR